MPASAIASASWRPARCPRTRAWRLVEIIEKAQIRRVSRGISRKLYLQACADNTGAKELKCIRVLGGSIRRYGQHRRRHRGLRAARPRPAAWSKRATSSRAVIVRTAQGPAPRTTAPTSALTKTPPSSSATDKNPERHPYLWACGPRAAREGLYEDPVAGARSTVRRWLKL